MLTQVTFRNPIDMNDENVSFIWPSDIMKRKMYLWERWWKLLNIRLIFMLSSYLKKSFGWINIPPKSKEVTFLNA
jgi:hypothetical protein